MSCGQEIPVLLVVPGFCSQYPRQISQPYSHQGQHLGGDRLSVPRRHPCISIGLKSGRRERRYAECSSCKYDRNVRPAGLTSEEIAKVMNPRKDDQRKLGPRSSQQVSKSYEPFRRERGHSPCATCKCHKDVRPAGLKSEEMWRALDLEGQRKFKGKKKTSHPSPRGYYSRRELHYPSTYQHYEGYREECNHRAHKKDDDSVLVAVRIDTQKPKGKFYVPAVSGRYNLEKTKVSVHFPDKKSKRGEFCGDRVCYHCKSHANMDKESHHSNGVGRKSLGKKNGPKPYTDGDKLLGVKEAIKYTKCYVLI